MTPKSLFTIILKIFGLFFIKEFICVIPSLISSVLYFLNGEMIPEALYNLLYNGGSILAYWLMSFMLIFRTGYILEKLKLDKDLMHEKFSFEKEKETDRFSIGVSTSLVLTIALIVIAGVILVDEIPNLCRQLYIYFQDQRSIYDAAKSSVSFSVLSIVKIVIAFLLIGERKRIIDFIEERQTPAVDNIEE